MLRWLRVFVPAVLDGLARGASSQFLVPTELVVHATTPVGGNVHPRRENVRLSAAEKSSWRALRRVISSPDEVPADRLTGHPGSW
jgi:hypothetical protein